MKVIQIGLGSMGKRRIRLLKQVAPDVEVVGIDSLKERREEAENDYSIKTYSSMKNIKNIGEYSCAIISTSPLSHADIINECLKSNLNVFTELNLVDNRYDENIELANSIGRVLFLSSTMLYRLETQYIKRRVSDNRLPLTYTYHVGQYLPDWHPWENYKDFFVGQKQTGGCREFMAIEFPWITDVFGDIKAFNVIKDNVSTLEVDYPDRYIINFEHHSSAKGSVIVDVVSRKACRNLELFGEDLYITWNGNPDGLIDYDFEKKKDNQIKLYDEFEQNKSYNKSIIEDAYTDEISDFMNAVINNTVPKYSFERDKQIIELINKIV